MLQIQHPRKTIIKSLAFAVLVCGCDDRATQIAREAANRQAQQNTEMANLNKEVAGGTHRLVEEDAQARKEIIGVHHELQSERSRLDTGWNALEEERRRIAGQRVTQSAFAAIASFLGGVALLIVLLGFCWYALFASHNGNVGSGELNELLIHELAHDEHARLTTDGISTSLLDPTKPNQ